MDIREEGSVRDLISIENEDVRRSARGRTNDMNKPRRTIQALSEFSEEGLLRIEARVERDLAREREKVARGGQNSNPSLKTLHRKANPLFEPEAYHPKMHQKPNLVR
ncbi:unnamed protein product [Sphenostylis stenocarpa]|uniref:Uncharacterized protein n=1 Tax=Sphenostylis stenocarpa TaxID=92480 RepID=A0AA86SCC3_9FABA|nr:unnamed protein product [Sphenostylis stenocarpa]